MYIFYNTETHSFFHNTWRMSRQGLQIWDQWGNWSSCSVTCGAGKISRWRHCISGSCSFGEKKAQLRTCTLPAC
ncbi:zinc metalloproteinase nas-36-like [Ptiloglossa arizonensis]|uniref:zinc metalloproteinase nas-36-like n=1 Tax=Ptiloglossa arizonensis TaxID=3350558 RepID=UPI003F9FBAE3